MPPDPQEVPTEEAPSYDIGSREDTNPATCNNFLARILFVGQESRQATLEKIPKATDAARDAWLKDVDAISANKTSMSMGTLNDKHTATLNYLEQLKEETGQEKSFKTQGSDIAQSTYTSYKNAKTPREQAQATKDYDMQMEALEEEREKLLKSEHNLSP